MDYLLLSLELEKAIQKYALFNNPKKSLNISKKEKTVKLRIYLYQNRKIKKITLM